ncbi:MAG TPA: adenosylcobinamide-GDP ribazoletransferase [Alphaproteobacteria bacterium]|nr:adenosylcobinamide-GDP ribazoletransferase [Alphaproteobacteria bacterium]
MSDLPPNDPQNAAQSAPEPQPAAEKVNSDKTNRDTATHILTGWWHDLIVALSFMTILPVRPKLPEGQDARAALRFGARAFPLAGLVVGAVGALTYAICSALKLPPEAAAFICIGAMIFFTGALHEDGLADLVDGAGSHKSVETRLQIMRDSRIGTFGTLALIIVVGIKTGSITALGWSDHVATMLLGSAAASRAYLPALMRYMAPARHDGLAVQAGRPEENQVVLALLLGAALSLLFLGPAAGLIAFAFGAGTAAFIGWFAKRRIGGLTGDVLGAAQQMSEAAIMLVVVALA